MSDVLRVNLDDVEDDRFSRFELIGWWDQTKLSNARALVIGAGALGNELLKNLALLGVGNIVVADLDVIENSNLSRSVLYRAEDCGQNKAEVAAKRTAEIYPNLKIQPWHGNVVHDLGHGIYRWADIILGGLDNREARVSMNLNAARAEKVWIDGAIERLDGVARVFDPATGPCYECTMSEVDWKMLEAKRSCALLSRDEMDQGKVPTTPTTSSVIAGIQVQEAVKLLHGVSSLSGQGFVFDGTNHQSYTVTYTQRDDCPSHDPFEPVEVIDWSVAQTTAGDFLERVRSDVGADAVIEVNNDLLESLYCPECNTTETLLSSLGSVSEARGKCPQCQANRVPRLYHTIDHSSSVLDKTLAELGVPLWDVIGGRDGTQQRYYEFAGDRNAVLGAVAQ